MKEELYIKWQGVKKMRPSDKERKLHRNYILMYQWILNRIHGLSIGDYLRSEDINNIAIYGCGDLGSLLIDELLNSEICIQYCIDRNAKKIQSLPQNIPVIKYEELESRPEVDVIIVTAVAEFSKIRKTIGEKYKTVVSLEEVIFTMGDSIWKI